MPLLYHTQLHKPPDVTVSLVGRRRHFGQQSSRYRPQFRPGHGCAAGAEAAKPHRITDHVLAAGALLG